jgi:hypothetical protein
MIQRHATNKRAEPADSLRPLREHLVWLLDGGNAHTDVEAAVADLSPKFYGAKPPNVPYSPWRLLEHMRIAQWDILEFCRNSRHVSPAWPDGYWPAGDAPPDEAAWKHSLDQFRADLAAMRDLVNDPATDLLKPIPHGEGQTLLREALLVADHNAYHLGQFVVVRRALGAWKAE